MGELDNTAEKGKEQPKETTPAAEGPSLFEQAVGGQKPPANLGGEQKVAQNDKPVTQPDKPVTQPVAQNDKPVTIDGGGQERKPANDTTFGEPGPPGQQIVQGDKQPKPGDTQKAPAEQQTERVGTDQATISPQFKESISKLVDQVATHMDSAAGYLRQRDVPHAMEAFNNAAMLVGPNDLKTISDARKLVKEQIELEQKKAQSEQDATKLQELKQLERNLFVLERAPGFTRANAALVLYQDGKVDQADTFMKDALQLDPSLKDDANFNTRRREIEQKHGIKVLASVFGEADAKVVQGANQPGADTQRGPPGATTEATGEKPQERVEQQRNAVSPTDQSGNSPLEQAYKVAEQFSKQTTQPKVLTPEMKTAMEQAIANADKGVTPHYQKLQGEQAKYGAQVGQFLNAKNGNETVKDTVKRIDDQAKNAIGSLAKPANVTVTEEQYRNHVAGLWTALDTVTSEKAYQEVVTNLKAAVPNNTQLAGMLDERTKATTQVRTALHPYNENGELLVNEVNQSANTRFLYAQMLKSVNDAPNAEKYFTEAFATNQMADEMDSFRTAANQAGVKDDVLLSAAVKQNEARGGASTGKALEVENLMGEALRQFGSAPENEKAAVLQKLQPSMDAIHKAADREYDQSLGKMKAMSAEYDKQLPSDPAQKAKLLELEKTLAAKEEKFNPTDRENIAKMMDPATPEAARTAARQAVATAQPDWLKAATEWQQLVGDKAGVLIGLKGQMGEESLNVEATMKNKFFTREVNAEMLAATGNKDGAKAKLTEAFGSLPQQVRPMFMNDDVKAVMQRVGLDAPAIQALPQPREVAATQQPADTTKGAVVAGDPTQKPGDPTQKPADPTQKPADPTQQVEKPAEGQKPGDVATTNNLNPKFKDASNEQLEEFAKLKSQSVETVPEAREAFEELVKRYDMMLPADQLQGSKDSIALLQKALQSGKDVKTGPDGKPVIDEATPLTEQRRFEFHHAIMGDIETMNAQSRVRLSYAQFLRPAGQLADAEKMGLDAKKFADALPIDLIKAQNKLLIADMETSTDDEKRKAMQGASQFLMGVDAESGVINMPINSRKFMAQLYLGTEVKPKIDKQTNRIIGIESIDFGKTSSFKPEKAYAIAEETRQKTIEIHGFDPLDKAQAGKQPAVASLFAGLTEVFDNPDKYNLYKVTDAHQVDAIKRQLKTDGKLMSTLVDIGVIVGVGAIMVASRNPRVISAFESGLGRIGATGAAAYAPQIAYATGLTTAIGGGLLGRHYGYKALTGMDESWKDSGMHLAGSLAAAEVGSRMLGKGSLLFGAGDQGPRWYANQYATTGELAKNVTNAEAARVLAAVPEGTVATSAEGLQAIRRAQIVAGGEKLVGGTDKLATGMFKKLDAEGSAKYYDRYGYKTTGQFQDLMAESGYGPQAAKLAGLPRGTAITSPEAVAAIKEAGLYGSRTGTISEFMTADLAKSRGVNELKLAEAMGKVDAHGLNGIHTIDDLAKFVEADQRAIAKLNELSQAANASPNAKIADAIGAESSTAEGRALLQTADRLGIKNVNQLRDMVDGAANLGFKKMFPKLGDLVDRGVINGKTTLTEATQMGKEVFAGNGQQRMLASVPEGAQAGILSPKEISKILAESQVPGGTVSRLKSAISSVGTGAKMPFTQAGRAEMGAAAKELPGKIGTKLSNAGHFVTDRFAWSALDPATATTQAVSRARWSTAFKGALGITTTYNSTAGAWDIHQNAVNPATGGNYDLLGALKEANFPTLPGEAPAWSKMLSSTMAGSVGQAFAASFFLRPGAITKPIWSEPNAGNFMKIARSTPISPRLWNNLNAGIFSKPAFAAGGAVLATQTMDGAMQGLEFITGEQAASPHSLARYGRMQDMLKRVQEPITNVPLPGAQKPVEAPAEVPVEKPTPKVEGEQKPPDQAQVQQPAVDTSGKKPDDKAKPGDEPKPPGTP